MTPINKFKCSKFLIILLLLTINGCNSTTKNNQNGTLEKMKSDMIDSSQITQIEMSLNDKKLIDTLEIIVVQAANGYEYEMFNYDFTPIIEIELDKFENIKVKPFPYKTLMGVAYQGVFDKKYCPPIIEKVDVDFLILTRFDKEYGELTHSDEMRWGYELKIVKTETLEQIKSINAHNLKDYTDIEKHIQGNIEKLKTDIEKLK